MYIYLQPLKRNYLIHGSQLSDSHVFGGQELQCLVTGYAKGFEDPITNILKEEHIRDYDLLVIIYVIMIIFASFTHFGWLITVILTLNTSLSSASVMDTNLVQAHQQCSLVLLLVIHM
eukprot:876260_1